jgi:hypothetical protein
MIATALNAAAEKPDDAAAEASESTSTTAEPTTTSEVLATTTSTAEPTTNTTGESTTEATTTTTALSDEQFLELLGPTAARQTMIEAGVRPEVANDISDSGVRWIADQVCEIALEPGDFETKVAMLHQVADVNTIADVGFEEGILIAGSVIGAYCDEAAAILEADQAGS